MDTDAKLYIQHRADTLTIRRKDSWQLPDPVFQPVCFNDQLERTDGGLLIACMAYHASDAST